MAKKPAKKSPMKAEESTFAKAKGAVVHAAEKVAVVVTHAAESIKDHVVTPVAQAVGLVKKKKPRYIRKKKEKKEPKPPKATTPFKPTAAGKIMSKNVKAAPMKAKQGGIKSKNDL